MPMMLWEGEEGDYYIQVCELLGPNLQVLLEACEDSFSFKTVLMIADQIFTLVEYFHSKNYLIRDIKPQNFAIGLYRNCRYMYICDCSLATSFKNALINPQFVGNPIFSSCNSMNGLGYYKKDDIEAIFYMIIYFLKGNLPWQTLSPCSNIASESFKRIKEIKYSTTSSELCENLPFEFQEISDYIKKLDPSECPDYSYLKRVFKEMLIKEGCFYDYVFDWLLLGNEIKAKLWSIPPEDLNFKKMNFPSIRPNELIDEDLRAFEANNRREEMFSVETPGKMNTPISANSNTKKEKNKDKECCIY